MQVETGQFLIKPVVDLVQVLVETRPECLIIPSSTQDHLKQYT